MLEKQRIRLRHRQSKLTELSLLLLLLLLLLVLVLLLLLSLIFFYCSAGRASDNPVCSMIVRSSRNHNNKQPITYNNNSLHRP